MLCQLQIDQWDTTPAALHSMNLLALPSPSLSVCNWQREVADFLTWRLSTPLQSLYVCYAPTHTFVLPSLWGPSIVYRCLISTAWYGMQWNIRFFECLEISEITLVGVRELRWSENTADHLFVKEATRAILSSGLSCRISKTLMFFFFFSGVFVLHPSAFSRSLVSLMWWTVTSQESTTPPCWYPLFLWMCVCGWKMMSRHFHARWNADQLRISSTLKGFYLPWKTKLTKFSQAISCRKKEAI